MKRQKRIVVDKNVEEVFHNLKELIMENDSDSFFIRYINAFCVFRIDMQSVSAFDQIENFIDKIAFKNESGIVLPDKFEKARVLILQLNIKKLQDVIQLTNE